MPPLGPRRLAAWTGGLSEVAGLEEAYDESTREGGKPTVEQYQAVTNAERLYIEREDITVVADEWAPVDGARTDDEAGSTAVDGAGVAE